MSIVLAGEFLTFSAFYEALYWLIRGPIPKRQTNFSEHVSFGSLSRSPSSDATQIPNLQRSQSAREEIQPGVCFNIVGLSPGKPFCSATKRCSGFGAVGSSFETPLLNAAVKMFKELKMCNVAMFCLRQNRYNPADNGETKPSFFKRLYLFPFEETVLLSGLSNSQWINTKWCCTHF